MGAGAPLFLTGNGLGFKNATVPPASLKRKSGKERGVL